MPRGVRSFRRWFVTLIAVEAIAVFGFLYFLMSSMDQSARFWAMAVFLSIAVFEGFLFLRGELKLLLAETPLLAGIRVRHFLARSKQTIVLIVVLAIVVAPIFIAVPLSTPKTLERRVSPLVIGKMDFWVLGIPAFRQDVTLEVEAQTDMDVYVIELGGEEGFEIAGGVPVESGFIEGGDLEHVFNLSVRNATESWRFRMTAGSPIDLYVVSEGVNRRHVVGADPAELRQRVAFLENCTYFVKDADDIMAHLILARGEYWVLLLAPEDANNVDLIAYRWSGGEPLMFGSGRSMKMDGALFPGHYSAVIFNLQPTESDVSIKASVHYLRPIGELLFLISLISLLGYIFIYLYARSVSQGIIDHITPLPDADEVEIIDEHMGDSLRRIRKKEFLGYLSEEAVKLKETGNRLFHNDRYEDALLLFDRALAIDPGNVNLWNNKALALRALNRFGEAIAAYDRAIALAPENEKFRAGRDACHETLRGRDESVDVTIRRERPGPDRARVAGGQRMAPLTTPIPADQAARVVGRPVAPPADVIAAGIEHGPPPVGEERPSPAPPPEPRAGVPLSMPSPAPPGPQAVSSGDMAAGPSTAPPAAQAAVPAPRVAPSEASAVRGAAAPTAVAPSADAAGYQVSTAKPPPAQPRQQVRGDPPEVLRRNGSRRLLAGNFKEAVELYERALAQESSDVPTWNNLGFAYAQQSDLQNAQRCYQMALRLDPGNQKAKKGLSVLKRA